MRWIEIAFWTSVGIVFYTYLGYGILLYLLVKIKRLFTRSRKYSSHNFEPVVTLIIPCFNEAEILEAKINNCKQLDYPKEKLHIIFITDGSTDNSVAKLKQSPGIEVLHENRRAGKTAAGNRAMKFVRTPFVIFSDANTMLNTVAVRNIANHFANEKVGCVSGEKKIISEKADSASAAGEGIYWKYESFLKKLDSEFHSAVGAAGELVAYRTNLYKDLPEDTLLDDFMQSMQIAASGKKIVYEPGAYALEAASTNVAEELKRKIRICTGGWQSIIRLANKLTLLKTPVLFFQYLSHRVLRWTITPFLLITIFVLNMFLINEKGNIYLITLIAQLLFYIAALIGLVLENRKLKFKPVFIPYYFVIMNYAVIMGLKNYLFVKQRGTWEKAQRKTFLQ